jgi:hypothetical protein
MGEGREKPTSVSGLASRARAAGSSVGRGRPGRAVGRGASASARLRGGDGARAAGSEGGGAP